MSPARLAALRVLLRLRRDRAPLDDSLRGLPEFEGLEERDRALAYELVTGTVKRRGSLDAALSGYLKAPLSAAAPAVREILRLAAFQLLFLDRVPAYAAVDDAVAQARAREPRAAGFVNAVLRRVAADGRARFAELAAGDGDGAWAVRHSVPRWLAAVLRRDLGDEEAARFLAAALEPPERCLRVNTLRSDMSAAREQLAAAGFATRGVTGLPEALVYEGPALERSAPFRDGLVTPQSRGSQAAGLVAAAAAPGAAAVLDLCAAPGTKTAQLAAARPGRLVAVDADEGRAAAMRDNLSRLGAAAEVLVADARELPAAMAGAFDAVLLDAPCSAIGTLAASADVRWRRRAADVARLAELQGELLTAAARCVRPGGVLTYSVCTPLRAETIDVVAALLTQGGWEADDLGASWPGLAHPAAGGYLLVLPPDGGSTAFFIARLRRGSGRG